MTEILILFAIFIAGGMIIKTWTEAFFPDVWKQENVK